MRYYCNIKQQGGLQNEIFPDEIWAPDAEQLKAELNGLTEKLKAAKSYTEAKELFLAEEKLNKHISTLANLAHIRHTIDTRDAFYDGEMKF